MERKKNKVVVIGSGAVGTSIAFGLSLQGLCDEIILIDINHDKATAEALDMQHGAAYFTRNIKIFAGGYKDCSDADIIVITAAVPYISGQRRLDMMDSAAKIMHSIIPPIMDSGFNGIFLVVTNPVDIMAHLVYNLSKLPKNQVFGTGTALDSARLRGMIAQLLEVDPQSVQAYTMGEHGDSQMIPWTNISVGGKPFLDVLADNKDRLGEVDLKQILKEIKEAAFKVGRIKRTTNYAIAVTVAEMIKIILNDHNTMIPVSTLLTGEFGEKGVFAGVPAILNKHGVREIVEVHLNQEEREAFKKSISIIKEYSNRLS